MKHTAVLLAFLLLGAVTTFANSNSDPRIIIKDPVCEENCVPVGTHFSFTSPASGFGTLLFQNDSGLNWRNLQLVESGVPQNDITCSSTAFMHCSVTTAGGITTILVFGVGGEFPGIGAGRNFSITFGTPKDRWPAGGVDFAAAANVPEPATLVLLVTGLGAGVIVTRRRKLLRQL